MATNPAAAKLMSATGKITRVSRDLSFFQFTVTDLGGLDTLFSLDTRNGVRRAEYNKLFIEIILAAWVKQARMFVKTDSQGDVEKVATQ